jgi:PPOX class probable FMN-dependent enzyme
VTAPRRLTTLSEIRELVGEPNPVTVHKISDRLDGPAREFIARSPFLVMSTVDASGMPQASPKGDEPGFVRVEDERTLVIPERKGNRLVMGLQNLLERPQVALLFLVPGTGETLRVEGEAVLLTAPDGEMIARGQKPLLVLRVDVRRVFFHCARAFKRTGLWDPTRWPAEVRVSFGEIIASRLGEGADTAAAIDRRVEDGYRNDL